MRGEKWSTLFFEYVNGHFSEENNTRGSTYSTSWVREFKRIYDDDDGGTVIDRKLIIFNNINTNSRFNYGAAAAAATAAATAAFVVVFAPVVAVLCAF